jgi:ectoine hydroxylase-related dioxygenase (phytanoyl-CoA dioxygenase family)
MSAPCLLSDDEIAAYRRDGYVVPRFRLEAGDLRALQQAVDEVVADNPGLLDQAIVSPHIPGSGVQALKVRSPDYWMQVASHPQIVDMVQQVVGPDVILWGTTLFYKRALAGPETGWHRDGQVWPIKPLATTTVWIAATESNTQNGCLRVIPGSHSAQRVGEHVFQDRTDMIVRRSLAKEEFDEGLARDIELEPGQMVMFDVYTVHGAAHNRGSIPRAGYALRFMPASSHFDHDGAENRGEPGYAHDTRALVLLRGSDRSGRNDFTRGHPVAAS